MGDSLESLDKKLQRESERNPALNFYPKQGSNRNNTSGAGLNRSGSEVDHTNGSFDMDI